MRPAAFALLALVPAAASLAAARRPSPARAEVARLRAHFDSVDAELRARDVSALGPAQRAARARHVAVLRAYRDRGRFPRNTDHPGRVVPYFVDRDGVACAVGYLLLRDGRADLVDRVRRADNHVRVAALAGDTAFRAWLDGAGLTLAEAARIQPGYGGSAGDDDVDAPSAVLTGVATALGGVTIGVNLAARPGAPGGGWRVGSGLAAGAVNLALTWAMVSLDDDRGTHRLAAVPAVVGLGSIAAAVYAGNRPRPGRSAAPGDGGAEPANRPVELSLAPGLTPVPGGRPRPAVVGRVRF